MRLRFDNRVVVVTGGGRGLGRCYALDLARRGAKVLVNDVGREGEPSATQAVVDEIRANGGTAIVSNDSVENGARIVEAALDQFGKIDVLINNAGLLQNNSFLKMSEEEWDIVYRVHLLGTMRVTKAAWPHMRDARFGRVIMTTSNAGYFGSVGAANYAAVKAGTIAFAKTLALEGASRSVNVNAIAPMAGSRLTARIWSPRVMEAFQPELVAPVVTWLCHEECQVTGRIFESGGGWLSEMRWEQSEGIHYGRGFSAEDVQCRWEEAVRFPETSLGTRANDYIERIEKTTGERVQF